MKRSWQNAKYSGSSNQDGESSQNHWKVNLDVYLKKRFVAKHRMYLHMRKGCFMLEDIRCLGLT